MEEQQQQKKGIGYCRSPFQAPNLAPLLPNLQQHLSGLADHIPSELTSFFQPVFRLGNRIQQRCHNVSQHHLSQRIAARPCKGFGSCFANLFGSQPGHLFDIALSQEQVAKTLEGVPVYTVSTPGNEFVLVSDSIGSKSLSLLCFRQQDAEFLLAQVREREPVLGRGAKVVAVSLDKVYKLTAEGIAFRFLPDPSQVKNAVEAKTKSGNREKVFDGVPVFQSEHLILRSSKRRFVPIFFRKEDLEKALAKALKQQQRANPSIRVNMDVQVGSLEDVLKKLEINDENSGWGDFIFVPPGKDTMEHLGKALG